MARPRGLEPLTAWFVAKYSIQLSYGRCVKETHYAHRAILCQIFFPFMSIDADFIAILLVHLLPGAALDRRCLVDFFLGSDALVAKVAVPRADER